MATEARPRRPHADAVGAAGSLELRSTVELLALGRSGQPEAIDALLRRCCPALHRWARGRLPAAARDLLDTGDLVQETVIRVLSHLSTFEARHEGALQAYLREAILNRIRDEARRVVRRPAPAALEDEHPSIEASPLEQLLGAERLAVYERALHALSPRFREAVVLRIELQYSYQEIADALGKANANAARSLVVRALYRLYEEMGRG